MLQNLQFPPLPFRCIYSKHNLDKIALSNQFIHELLNHHELTNPPATQCAVIQHLPGPNPGHPAIQPGFHAASLNIDTRYEYRGLITLCLVTMVFVSVTNDLYSNIRRWYNRCIVAVAWNTWEVDPLLYLHLCNNITITITITTIIVTIIIIVV